MTGVCKCRCDNYNLSIYPHSKVNLWRVNQLGSTSAQFCDLFYGQLMFNFKDWSQFNLIKAVLDI